MKNRNKLTEELKKDFSLKEPKKTEETNTSKQKLSNDNQE